MKARNSGLCSTTSGGDRSGAAQDERLHFLCDWSRLLEPNRLRRFLDFYCAKGLMLYPLILAKGLLIALVNQKFVSPTYGWLDCCLVGRYVVSPRLSETSRNCLIVFASYQIVSRYIIRSQMRACSWSCFKFLFIAKGAEGAEGAPKPHKVVPGQPGDAGDDPSGFVKNRFAHGHEEEEEEPLLLKPNRTPRVRALYGFIWKVIGSYFILTMPIIVLISYRTFTPLWLTQHGFLLAHKRCITWMVLDNYNLTRGRSRDVNSDWPHSRGGSAGPASVRQMSLGQPANRWDFVFPFELIPPRMVREILDSSARDMKLELELPKHLEETRRNERDERLPMLLPLKDLVPLNLYQTVRIGADFFEGSLVCFETIIAHFAYYICCLYFSIDVLVYSSQLNRMLVELIRKMHRQSEHNLCLGLQMGSQQVEEFADDPERERRLIEMLRRKERSRRPVSPSGRSEQDHWVPPTIHCEWAGRTARLEPEAGLDRGEISHWIANQAAHGTRDFPRIQTLIHDYFNQVGGYNAFVGQVTLLHVCLWMTYSFILAIRAFVPPGPQSQSGGAIELEFYVVCGSSSLFVVAILGAESLVKSSSQTMYRLISTAMALDQADLDTKLRWPIILKYYRPRCLHCFSIFGSIELSFLYLLKLLSWVISVLVIIHSFAM